MSKRKPGKSNRRRVKRHRARARRRLAFRVTGTMNPNDNWFVLDDLKPGAWAGPSMPTADEMQRLVARVLEDVREEARSPRFLIPPASVLSRLLPEPVLVRGPRGECVVVLPSEPEVPEAELPPLDPMFEGQLRLALARLKQRLATRR